MLHNITVHAGTNLHNEADEEENEETEFKKIFLLNYQERREDITRLPWEPESISGMFLLNMCMWPIFSL